MTIEKVLTDQRDSGLLYSTYAVTHSDVLNLYNTRIPTIQDKLLRHMYSNRVTSENKIIHTPSPSPPFKVGVFVVFYR